MDTILEETRSTVIMTDTDPAPTQVRWTRGATRRSGLNRHLDTPGCFAPIATTASAIELDSRSFGDYETTFNTACSVTFKEEDEESKTGKP